MIRLKRRVKGDREKVLMKKYLCLVIIFFMSINDAVFATGMISVPPAVPSQAPAPLQQQPPTQIKIQTPMRIQPHVKVPVQPSSIQIKPQEPVKVQQQAKQKVPAKIQPPSMQVQPQAPIQAKTLVKPSTQMQKTPQVSTETEKVSTPPAVKTEDAFRPTIEPIQKAEPPLQIGTSAEVPIYKKLSLQEAIDYAMSHNLDIKSTRLETNKAKNNIKIAGRLLNPRIESFYNLGQAAIDNPNYFGLIFPIELFKRSARKKLAKSNLELTKGNVALAELTLRLDVRQAYVDLVAAKSILKILDDQRQLLQELLNIAQRKYEVGAVPQMDVIQAKMTLNQLLIQVNSARTEVLVARYKFNLLLGSKDLDTREDYLPVQKQFVDMLTPKPIEKIPSFDCIADSALSKRLDIKNAKQDVDVAQKNLIVVIRQRVPDIELGGGFLFVPPQLATAGTLTTGALIIGNITNIPLLYQYSPEIKNAKILMDQKELIYNNTKHVALMNLHSAYDTFSTAQMNLNYYNDVLLSESSQFLHMAKRSYEVGKTNMTNLIFIEQSYKDIIMGYTNALAEYYNSWVDVLKEVNDEGLKLNG